MISLEQTVDGLVPDLYEAHIEKNGWQPGTDVSRSNQCQNLTYDFMEALQARGYVMRREFHRDDETNTWHFLLAHTEIDAMPTELDIITDLNPWQGTEGFRPTGYLHGTREEVMEKMEQGGVPDYLVALRSLQTIIRTHEPDKASPLRTTAGTIR